MAIAPRPPPIRTTGPIAWARDNLFGSWPSGFLTVAVLVLLAWLVPELIRWALIDAVWSAKSSDACKAVDGACWAMIREKFRLILFGRFPFEEQWRPLVGMMVLLATVLASCNRRFWRPWLPLAWIGGGGVFLALMWGGFAGMSLVRTGLWGGLPLTLMLSVFGLMIAFPLSIFLALGRRSNLPAIRALCVAYIELIRGVPLISLLFMASFMLPLFLPAGVTIDALLRALIAFVLFAAAYLAEVVRGGLQAIPRGQVEAAQALGLHYWQIQLRIVLPQALRLVIPPTVSTFIGFFKDTSLVAIVALTDLLLAMRQAIADPVWRPVFVEGYVFVAAIFFVFCYAMSRYSRYLERSLDTGRDAPRQKRTPRREATP
jgi:general L-amino acid transport system permease protein